MFPLVRTEFTKAARRTRTLIIAGLLVVLPTLIVLAINARGTGRGRDQGEGLFRLAQQSGYLVPAAVLSAMSGFLLVVIAGTFAGAVTPTTASLQTGQTQQFVALAFDVSNVAIAGTAFTWTTTSATIAPLNTTSGATVNAYPDSGFAPSTATFQSGRPVFASSAINRASIVAMNSVSPSIATPRLTRPQQGRACDDGV